MGFLHQSKHWNTCYFSQLFFIVHNAKRKRWIYENGNSLLCTVEVSWNNFTKKWVILENFFPREKSFFHWSASFWLNFPSIITQAAYGSRGRELQNHLNILAIQTWSSTWSCDWCRFNRPDTHFRWHKQSWKIIWLFLFTCR